MNASADTATRQDVPELLTDTDAAILRAAAGILGRIDAAAMQASWSAPSSPSAALPAAYLGRVAEACGRARDAITRALITAEVYGKQVNAADPEDEDADDGDEAATDVATYTEAARRMRQGW